VAETANSGERAHGCGGRGRRACFAAAGERREWRRSERVLQGEPGRG
jgi:hypothetical protein